MIHCGRIFLTRLYKTRCVFVFLPIVIDMIIIHESYLRKNMQTRGTSCGIKVISVIDLPILPDV